MTGYIKDIIASMENGVYDFTVNNECSNCGQCCSDLLPVSLDEIKAIRRYIAKHGIKEQKHFFPTAIVPKFDLTCPFRDNDGKKCVIYKVRPAICREFRCDKPREQIELDKRKFHAMYMQISMRATFFGGK